MAYLKSQGCYLGKLDATASPNTYETIGQVVSIAGPDGNVPEVDVTHLLSTGKEFVGGLPDFGSVTLTVIWDQATTSTLHNELYTDFTSQATDTYRLFFSDSPQSTLTFTAYPNQYSWTLGVDERVEATVGLKVSGAPTLA